jgi:hypothetical protein
MILCEYGCGREGKYKFKNGKWCCSEKWQSCPKKRKDSITMSKAKKIENLEHKKCDFGCGLEAEYQFENGRLCCSESQNSCLVERKRNSESKKGIVKTKAKKIENIEHKLCDYDCGLKAEYQFVNKKLCCSEKWQQCLNNRSKISKTLKGRSRPESIKIENLEHKKCDYGCGLIAKYKFDNGKYCCDDHCMKCPDMIRKNSESNLGRVHTQESINKISISHKGKVKTIEHRKNLSKALKYTIKQWQEKYPFFGKIEEMRYNPDKPGEKEIQVHCKNHNCEHSKEKGGWFTPELNAISTRAGQLTYPDGSDGAYFYCCDECKKQCPLFDLHNDPFKNIDLPYTQEEYNIWRQEVLKRQKDGLGYNECEICGNTKLKELQVHHEIPIKKNWIFSLDPDNGIILCVKKERQKEEETCHFKYGHKTGTECSTGNLANTICI